MNKYKKKLEEIAYYLGNMGIFRTEIIKDKIHELEVETNQFLFIHSANHRRDYYNPFENERKKFFYWKERKAWKESIQSQSRMREGN